MKQLLSILWLCLIGFHLQAQDLTGTWKGEQDINGQKYDYTLYLSKSNNNGYIGISYLKKQVSVDVNVNNLRANVKTDLFETRPGVKYRILGGQVNNTFAFTELGIIETEGNVKNWKTQNLSLNYVQIKGKEKLIESDKVSFEFEKTNNKFPKEYSKYMIKEFVSLSSVSYTGVDGQNQIKFNDKGQLNFTLTNNTEIDFQKIDVNFIAKGKSTDIQGAEGNVGSISLLKSQTEKANITLTSGFDIPSDSVRFSIDGTCNGILLFSQNFALATMPFYHTDKTEVSKASSKVMSALQGYYGFNKATYSPVSPSLDKLIANGTQYASMWKGLFKYMGLGEFVPNENEGFQLAKQSYNDVVSGARNGDAEAQYLLFYAIEMGLGETSAKKSSAVFLKKASDAGFAPAMFDYALVLYNEKNYEESYNTLQKCYDNGVQKTAVNIGYFYQKGYFVGQSSNKALEWYQKGEAFGDPDAMMQMARLYSDGEDEVEPDAKKAIAYAKKASATNSPVAMDYLANIYLNGRPGVPKNIPNAVSLFKAAANLGDYNAMTVLAFLYNAGKGKSIPKDEKKAFFWAKKSAELGSAKSMALLAYMYGEGDGAEKNIIKSRFWTNQAQLWGIDNKQEPAANTAANDFLDILKNADFSPSYYTVEENWDGSYTVESGEPDYIGGMMTSALDIWLKSRMKPQQPVINGLEFMYQSGGKKIYGGTVTSTFLSELSLKKGQTIKVNSYGYVKLGLMLSGGPGGVYGYQSYSVDPEFPHGSVMVGINKKWAYMGAANTYEAPVSGRLQIAINDADYTNNEGYFDIVIVSE